ncbi:glycosyltransferase family 2 protein [Papillibacter cinnamivorans]|uniref:Glycosyltransferase involved in cell wall bisynthesis n=1 Tax=Papillibacter cinnamivorans DSM 12816 TaxID=1122930 RepID=A0A1W2CDE1_9FIRM|nr:glycosyltransferase family 2 protein [Papillibacter cinnamivorans]SMC83297.1 Glycosyltransferase involved in cell wall bisynthesis [Papillibacter cinnamivorans DSM 12816]
MKPLVSVIIPVYNTEPYLRRCLESVVAQTYDPLEIILVDNASTDGSSQICLEFAERDRRIRLICLEKNNGPGAGRNAALAAVSGEYIGFVDSDDYVDPDMFSYLAENAVLYGSDITICGFYEEEGGSVIKKSPAELTQYSADAALRELLADRVIQNYLWQKLFKVHLFSGVSFPTFRVYCDLSSYKLFLPANKVVYLPEAKYHYRILPDSACHRIAPPYYMDRADLLIRRADDLMKTHPDLKSYLCFDLYCAYSLYYEAAAKYPDREDLRSILEGENLYRLRAARKDLAASERLGFLGRLEMNLMCRGSGLGRFLVPRIHELIVFTVSLRQKLQKKRGSS